jgi:Calcineurin-like phosphoesterase
MGNRILDLTAGITLVAADLYGDWDAFTRYIGRFRQLRSRHRADRLLFLGDLIHANPRIHTYADASFAILTALIQLRNELGSDSIVVVAGDHEIGQQYKLPIPAIGIGVVELFEKVLRDVDRDQRSVIAEFFDQMPLFIRTASGVTFTHAGASRSAIMRCQQVSTGDNLDVLWDVVATLGDQAESQPVYARLVEQMLATLSMQPDAPATQRFLVTGHLPVAGGYAIVTPRQLRIASAACANPRETGMYLLFDAAQPIHSLEGLAEHTGSVFNLSTL